LPWWPKEIEIPSLEKKRFSPVARRKRRRRSKKKFGPPHGNP